MSSGFLEDGIFHVGVGDDIVGDEEGIDGAKEEEGDGGADGVEFGDGEEEEESLDASADQEEGLKGEVLLQALGVLVWIEVSGEETYIEF